jgi:hypothetical protein
MRAAEMRSANARMPCTSSSSTASVWCSIVATAPCASCERTALAPGPSACRGQRGRAPVETSERRLSATNSRTASICSRVTSNCSITSSMLRSSKFDDGRHRQTSTLEHPGAAHLPGNALDGLALRPVKRCMSGTPSLQIAAKGRCRHAGSSGSTSALSAAPISVQRDPRGDKIAPPSDACRCAPTPSRR